jgi:hypothetical protein
MGLHIKTLRELKANVKAEMSDLFDGPDDDEPNFTVDQIIEAVIEAAYEWGRDE